MKKTLLHEFCSYHPNFLTSLESFTEANRKSLLHKLNEVKDKANFLSTVAEISFGKLFVAMGFSIEYDKVFPNKQTPDWTIKDENRMAICEVYRLGKSEKDQKRSNFENTLLEKIKKIPLKYWLILNFIDEYFDTSKFEIDAIVNKVKIELTESQKSIGDTFLIENNFEFQVIGVDISENHIICEGNANSIEIKLHKIEQIPNFRPNEITKKLSKYNDIISEYNFPYFLCIYIDFESGFDEEDISLYFLGKGVTDISSKINRTWTNLGEFYSNPALSGIGIYFNGKFSFLINPNKNQIVYSDNYSVFKKKFFELNKIRE